MIKILEPLKIGNSHSANVGEHVWDHYDASLLQYLVSLECCGSICSFNYDFGLDVWCIVFVETAIDCTGSKNMTFILQNRVGIGHFNLISVGISRYIARHHGHLDIVRIHAPFIVQPNVSLDDADDFGTAFMHLLGKVVADVAETLHDDFFIFDAWNDAYGFGEGLGVEELFHHVEAAESSRFFSASYTSLGDELACNAAFGVDLFFAIQIMICVFYPCHDLLVGAHVRSQHI